MPRSATKSKAESRRRRSSVQVTTPPTQDVEEEDSNPLAQWTDILIQEDAEETVGEIIDDLLSKVMEGCYKVYIERQLATFSASWAKSYLTQILERQMLCLDEGEGPEEACKTEDSECMPATTDAWAQGCVPVVNATRQPLRASKVGDDTGQFTAQTEPRISQKSNAVAEMSSSQQQAEKESSSSRPVTDKHCKMLVDCPTPKTYRKKMQLISSLPKHVPGNLLPPLSCSTEAKDVEIERKNMRHSVHKHMARSLYQNKDCQLISRLEPFCLPQHCIFPQYEIVDNSYTNPNPRELSGLSRQELRQNKQLTERTVISLKPLTSSKDQPDTFQKINENNSWLKKLSPSIHRKEQIALGSPLKLDTVVLAKGVSLLDPQGVQMNPLRFSRSQSVEQRPIQTDAALPLYSANQVT